MTLSELLSIEKELHLDDIVLEQDIPLWRICRQSIRLNLLNFKNKTIKPNISYVNLIINITVSAYKIFLQIITKRHVEYIIFPHARLYKINGKYIDKLTDPLIDLTKEIKDSFCIMQYPQNGVQNKPRYNAKHTINLDVVKALSLLWYKFKKKSIYNDNKDAIEELLMQLSKYIDKTRIDEYRELIVSDLAWFIFSYKFYSVIIASLSPKQVLIANRFSQSAAVVYCKRNGILTSELEHGITLTDNILYSGIYSSNFDVDYFLTFGNASNNACFGMPLDKVLNIGFAYIDWLKFLTKLEISKYTANDILIISEPHITDTIVDISINLAKKYSSLNFHIRCHPQEVLSSDHMKKIQKYNNVICADNREESFKTLLMYENIIGENSSVIFEAISLGKRVGRINFGGLHPINHSADIYGGIMINSYDDFEMFLQIDVPILDVHQTAYSVYNSNIIPNLKLQ